METLFQLTLLTLVSGSPFFPRQDFQGVPVAAHPNGRFIYVGDIGTSTIWSIAVDHASGALTPVPPPASSDNPQSLTVTPSGRFLYATRVTWGGEDDVAGFRIDQESGALAPLPGSPFPAGDGISRVEADPLERFVLVTQHDYFIPGISMQRIDGATGSLSPAATTRTLAGTLPDRAAFSPNGGFAFVSSRGSAEIWGFVVPHTGLLTPVPGAPFPSGAYPQAIATTPSGGFVYVANGTSADVSAYRVSPETGTLSFVPGSPFYAGPGIPTDIVVDPSGRYAYAAHYLNRAVSSLAIDWATGALTHVASVQVSNTPQYLATSPY